MKILVSGSHGLIGSALLPSLTAAGHSITRLVRSASPTTHEGITWDPPTRGTDPHAFTGMEAVVHLAGESIASRWTGSRKAAIFDSRVKGTQLLVNSLIRMKEPPRVLVSASAIGFYGNRGAEALKEDQPAGQGFLSDVCRQWEAATVPAAQRGIRVVNLRFGIVLSSKGGALAKMLWPFKLGLGGVIGTGNQYMSWVALDDVIGAIQFALTNEPLRGPVNVASPRAVTNRDFTKTLGKVLSRPTIFPLPAFAARLVFGEMADALLLSSTRAEPAALINKAYKFRYGDLEGALRHLLDR